MEIIWPSARYVMAKSPFVYDAPSRRPAAKMSSTPPAFFYRRPPRNMSQLHALLDANRALHEINAELMEALRTVLPYVENRRALAQIRHTVEKFALRGDQVRVIRVDAPDPAAAAVPVSSSWMDDEDIVLE